MLLLFLLFSHPKAFPDWNSECFVQFMSDFRDCDCLHFFSVHKQHWEYPRRWNNLGDASRGVEMAKVFLVHFSGVLVCAKKRFPLLRVSNCQPRNLPTNSTLKYFFSWSLLVQPESRPFKQRIWSVPRISRDLRFRTLPSDFPRSDKIIFQLQMKNETKSGLETKNFCEILVFWRIIEPRKRDRRSCFDNQTKTESLRENFLLGCCSSWRCASVGARSVRGLLLAQERRQSNNLWMFRPYL